MPVTKDTPAPYAPTSAILDLIERHRNKGFARLDAESLGRAGVSNSLISRTLQALHTLDLIDEEGKPSQIFEEIRRAPEGEYKQRLAEWLKGAYGDALSYVDPSTDDETRVRDAFRNYRPFGQQERMVNLFMGLHTAAGIAPEKERQPRKSQNSSANMKPRHTPVKQARQPSQPSSPRAKPNVADGQLPAVLAALLEGLPQEARGWTKERRDQFMHTFSTLLDFCFPFDEGKHASKQEYEEN